MNTPIRYHAENPAARVEAAFRRIHAERMSDVPILNPALAVETVDFARHDGHWLGIVIAPWCMSLLLVPGDPAVPWEQPPDGQRRYLPFPAGALAFLGSVEAELGEFQSCSLFSPMSQFGSQEDAVLTARAALVALRFSKPPSPSLVKSPPLSPSRRQFLTFRP